jgi:hypothetical protein
MTAPSPQLHPGAAGVYSRHAATSSQRATYYGVVTWVTNFFSFLLTAVPIAIPISVVLFIISVVTGFMAMYYGFIGWRETRAVGGDLYRDALIGFVLGTAHFAFLIGFAITVVALLYAAGVLPPQPQ